MKGFPVSSVGIESACNAGDPGSIHGSGRFTGEGLGYPHPVFLGFPGNSAGKESTCTHSLTQSKLVQTRNGESEARNLTTLLGKIVFFIPLGSLGFPGGSDSNESACNAGDLGSLPRLGRSPGEGKGSHSIILAWRIPWTV